MKETSDIDKIDSGKLNNLFKATSNSNTVVLFLNNMDEYLNDYKLLSNSFFDIKVSKNPKQIKTFFSFIWLIVRI